MGELIALAVCVAGLASYTAIGFVIHSTSTIAKIASFGIGIPYTAVASLFAVSPTDSLSVTEASAPKTCLLYTSPSPRDRTRSRMPSSA